MGSHGLMGSHGVPWGPMGSPWLPWKIQECRKSSILMKTTNYSVRQKIGEPGSKSMRNIFPLHPVTSKRPESPYGAKYFVLAGNPVFQFFGLEIPYRASGFFNSDCKSPPGKHQDVPPYRVKNGSYRGSIGAL